MPVIKSTRRERVYVAGHRGMVGAALCRALKARGDCDLVVRSRAELDLGDAMAVKHFFDNQTIDSVYLAAARVGGIHANHTYPADFIYQNLMIEANVIHQAWLHGIDRLLFLGSSCIYPRLAQQPMSEAALLSGPLEPTNEPYAIAKIAGIKLCESYNRQHGTDYRSIMPTNLYGPGDSYHPQNSHVLPALLQRMHEAMRNDAEAIVIWGSGKPRREFLHVDDLANACLHMMQLERQRYAALVSPQMSHINVGSGEEVTIAELAGLLAEIVGFDGDIRFDTSQPDGAPRKLLDSSKLRSLGWQPSISLREGIQQTYLQYLGERDGHEQPSLPVPLHHQPAAGTPPHLAP